jgi:hypothetical protein
VAARDGAAELAIMQLCLYLISLVRSVQIIGLLLVGESRLGAVPVQSQVLVGLARHASGWDFPLTCTCFVSSKGRKTYLIHFLNECAFVSFILNFQKI